jgi:hypothetical protein
MSRSPEAYAAAFEAERVIEYPVMDALEERYGYKIDRDLLERMARVLACPLKRNPCNWQHGRLVYALARHRLAQNAFGCIFLDIGTAKGFSALCMAWAAWDAKNFPRWIVSYDVIDPVSPEPRNSVMDGQVKTGIWDYVRGFLPPDAHGAEDSGIAFARVGDANSAHWLQDHIGFAFIDGAHTYEGVKADIELVTARQKPGDIILFDDFNLPPVESAVCGNLPSVYNIDPIDLKLGRAYAIATRVA